MVYVSFLTPLDTEQPPPTSTMQGIRSTMKNMLDAKGKEGSTGSPWCVRRNDEPAPAQPRPPTIADVITRRRIPQSEKSSNMNSELDSSTTLADPQHRRSSRTNPTKRSRYEPEAMGQGPKIARALYVSSTTTSKGGHLNVDSGASQVLFRLIDSDILHHVEMSPWCLPLCRTQNSEWRLHGFDRTRHAYHRNHNSCCIYLQR
jgi:hypothetical protein